MMGSRNILITFCLIAFVIVAQAGNVVELDEDNFLDYVGSSRSVLVKFFAPWCGHCKSMAADYEEVAGIYNKKFGEKVIIAEVDCDKQNKLCEKHGVEGFPTLKFYSPEMVKPDSDDNIDRELNGLVQFINKKTGLQAGPKKSASSVVELDTSNFEKITTAEGKTVLVEFYAPWCGHCKSFAPQYELVGRAFRAEDSVTIAKLDGSLYKHISQDKKFDVKGFPSFRLFKNGKIENFEAERTVEAFVASLNSKAGTNQLTNGRLAATVGRVEELDKISSAILESSDKDNLIKQAKVIQSKLLPEQARSGLIYVKMMEKAAKLGKEAITSEINRLNKYIDEDSVNPSKLKGFCIRLNILNTFLSESE